MGGGRARGWWSRKSRAIQKQTGAFSVPTDYKFCPPETDCSCISEDVLLILLIVVVVCSY